MHHMTKIRLSRRGVAAMLVATACLAAGTATTMAASPQAISEASARGGMAGARAAATRDLTLFVAQHANGAQELVLDVATASELGKVRVAYGFPVYSVDPGELLAGRRSLRSLTAPTGQYRFVLALGDKPVGMATVESINGRFTTVAYGAAVLAKDVDASMRAHANTDRLNVRFVRVFQARSDVLEIAGGNAGTTRYAPLHSARSSLQLATSGAAPLLEEADIVQPLRSAVKANINAMR